MRYTWLLLGLLSGCVPLAGQTGPSKSWDVPVPYDVSKIPDRPRLTKNAGPFEVMDGLYYVGNERIASHLLTSKEGLILIDTPFPHQVPMLLENITRLGFRPEDIELVIGTHAHIDHVGGHRFFQERFGARIWMHEADADAAERGGRYLMMTCPAFRVDRRLKGGEKLAWGGRTILVHHTPGHTPGTISLEIPLRDGSGKSRKAILFGPGTGKLSPERTRQSIESLRYLAKIDAEVFLAVHPFQNDALEKARLLASDAPSNPFIDPKGWKAFLRRCEEESRAQLQ